MWNFTRKGQMEIIGLVIVVILIALGMLFLLKFVVFQPVGEERVSFTQSQLASNTLGSILNTITTCQEDGKVTISDLIQDCASGKDCDGDVSSCDFLRDTVSLILDSSLKEWNRDYEFMVVRQTQNLDLIDPIVNGDCTQSKKGSNQPLRTRSRELLNVQLNICN